MSGREGERDRERQSKNKREREIQRLCVKERER